jgi:hypothetical protein
MPAAVTIDDAIAYASGDIAALSYGGVKSLYTQMGLWIAGMFGTTLDASSTTGIFPPSQNATKDPGQKVVTNWVSQSVLAKAAIEGTTAGSSKVPGTSAVIEAVVRALYAVKFGTTANYITTTQRTAVIALYNLTWQ